MGLESYISQPLPYLVLRAGGRLCALPLGAVIEVLRVPGLEAPRQTGQGLLGFAMLRGETSAVFALAALLGFEAANAHESQSTEQRLVRIRLAGAAGLYGESGKSVDSSRLPSAALVVDEVIGIRTMVPEDLTRIDLPGGREQTVGRFDEEFASMIALGGLLPVELPGLVPQALESAVDPAPAAERG